MTNPHGNLYNCRGTECIPPRLPHLVLGWVRGPPVGLLPEAVHLLLSRHGTLSHGRTGGGEGRGGGGERGEGGTVASVMGAQDGMECIAGEEEARGR